MPEVAPVTRHTLPVMVGSATTKSRPPPRLPGIVGEAKSSPVPPGQLPFLPGEPSLRKQHPPSREGDDRVIFPALSARRQGTLRNLPPSLPREPSGITSRARARSGNACETEDASPSRLARSWIVTGPRDANGG